MIESCLLDYIGDWTMIEVIYSCPDYIEEIRKIKTSLLLIYRNRITDMYIDCIIRYLIREMNTRYFREFSHRLRRPVTFNDLHILVTSSYIVYMESLKILIPILREEKISVHNAAHALLLLNGNAVDKKIPLEFLLTQKLLSFISHCVNCISQPR